MGFGNICSKTTMLYYTYVIYVHMCTVLYVRMYSMYCMYVLYVCTVCTVCTVCILCIIPTYVRTYVLTASRECSIPGGTKLKSAHIAFRTVQSIETMAWVF